MISLSARYQGCLLGLAAGDAVGTTVEFRSSGTFEPLTDMIGGGPFGLEPGQWTDDTSMALCLADSLVECRGFDANDQMKRYCRWRDDGYLSSNGRCFDIGNTVGDALSRFHASGEPFSGSTHPRSAGNGSIMRLAPVALFYYPKKEVLAHYARESSRTTHGAAECLDACEILGEIIRRCLDGQSKETVLSPVEGIQGSARIQGIAAGAYRDLSREDARGTGYVVDSLEAALWCFAHTSSFPEAILAAANLGDDADTTAAVCGQVAGAYYGIHGIPPRWREMLAHATEITLYADRLLAHP